MERIRLFTWCWWSYFRPTKENTRFKLRYVFAVFLPISLLECFLNFHIFWFFCIITLFLSLAYYPKLILGALLIFLLCFVSLKLINLHNIIAYADGNYKIVSKTSMGPIIKIQDQRVLVETNGEWYNGDVIYVKGNIESIVNNGDFDLKGYLNTKWVDNIIIQPEVHLHSSNQSWFNTTRKYISNGPTTFKKIAPLLLLGKKNHETKEVFGLIKNISVVHLFVISGFHIGILYKVINWLLKKIKINNSGVFSLIPIIPYVILLNWTLPALRAFLFISLVVFTKKFKVDISSFTILSFIAAIFLIYNPYNINSLSYILTFTSTIVIIYMSQMKFKKIIKYFIVNLFVFIATAPIIIKINGFFPIMAPIFSVIYTPIVSSLYMLTFLLLPFKVALIPFYNFFIFLLKTTNKMSLLIKVNELSYLGLFIYYSLFVILTCSLERINNHLYTKLNLKSQRLKK